MYTDLTYVNNALDHHCPRIVVAQRNLLDLSAEWAVAWRVIQNCGHLCWHPFRFDWELALEVEDAFGNRSARVETAGGERFVFVSTGVGQKTLIREKGEPGGTITLVNRGTEGAIRLRLYRGKRLLSLSPMLAPGQVTGFCFDQTVLLGTSIRRNEGEMVELARLMGPPAAINLSGVRKAQIVLSGGGPGPWAQPLRFHLEKEELW